MVMTQERTLLDAVTADTTSAALSVEGYSKVGFQFKAAAISAGNGVFTVEGTINGVDFVTLPLITVAANTNAQTLIRVLSVTLSSNTTALVWLDTHMALKAVRAKVDMTTDGAYSAQAIASS